MFYTELEFVTAGEIGLPRLVFLLDPGTEGPSTLFIDAEHGKEQAAFRQRLTDSSGLVAAAVTAGAPLPGRRSAPVRRDDPHGAAAEHGAGNATDDSAANTLAVTARRWAWRGALSSSANSIDRAP